MNQNERSGHESDVNDEEPVSEETGITNNNVDIVIPIKGT